MRLRQLLGLLTLLLILSAAAMAAGPQLTNVSAQAQGNAAVITLHASGAFTHTEYRPLDSLLLVDLSGVSAGSLKDQAKEVSLPGVLSYRIVGYTGANGADVARVELKIAPGSVVDVQQSSGALTIRIGDKDTVAVKPQKPAVPVRPQAAPMPAAPVVTAAAKPVGMKTETVAPAAPKNSIVVANIGVARGEDAMDIEIEGNAPMTAKATRLASPPRVVIDIPNALPVRNKTISVNSGDVKAVRMGRFQEQPPTTRVVVDLTASREYEVLPIGNKILVRVHEPVKAKYTPAKQAPVVAATQHTPAPVTPDVQLPPVQKAALKEEPKGVETVVVAKEELKPQTATVAPVLAKSTESEAVKEEVKLAEKTETAKTETAKTEEKDSKDFVMVEPEYHAATPEPAPSVKDPKVVAEAAASVVAAGMKASEPAPIPVSASMAPRPTQQQPQSSAPARPKYTGEPISVNLKDVDLKDFFRLVHEISGLNIVLDPNVKGTLTLVLDDVPWDQALDLVLANNGLDRKLEGNVLRIATVETLRKEADALRAKNEAEALSVPKVTITHFLSYAKAADVVPTVKRFLTQRGDVIADNRTNALIIQDIPATIPEVQRLLAQLDRKTQEVEIEARVIASTRSFARDIGTQIGFGWGNGPSAVGGATSVGTSPLQVAGNVPKYFIVGTDQIPLFTNMPAQAPTSGISFNNFSSNYRLDVILTAAESRGLLKILSRPRVVTQNNVLANVKQGVRVPVVTQAQLGGPPTTTYIEAFLRLTVTPQITVENTIFLNIDVENTTPDFTQQVQGNPTLITQQATTSVLVSDGGTVVIGGVIQTQNNVTTQQVPLLGDLPILGNLFKRRLVRTATQELLFFVTPKIVQT
jgi:type IV pilus assembly protein PilQ